MPPAAAIGVAAGGLLGGIAGSQSKKESSKSTSGINQNPVISSGLEQQMYGKYLTGFSEQQQADLRDLQVRLEQAGGDEDLRGSIQKQINHIHDNPEGQIQQSPGFIQQQFDLLKNYAAAGPGQQDISNAYNSQKSLADLLGSYVENGGVPTQNDINQSNTFANNIFAARQTGLNQSFTDQGVQAARLSAQLGRSPDDPILQAKLRTGFIKQQDSLNAEKQGLSAQYAQSLPGQRVGYASQQANVLSGLGNQAFQTQSYLLGLGNQLGNQEQAYRLNTSQRYNNGSQSSGGGLGGAISGALGGAGAGFQAASLFSGGGQGFSGSSGGTQFNSSPGAANGGFNLGDYKY